MFIPQPLDLFYNKYYKVLQLYYEWDKQTSWIENKAQKISNIKTDKSSLQVLMAEPQLGSLGIITSAFAEVVVNKQWKGANSDLPLVN